jgi:cell division protein FtsX
VNDLDTRLEQLAEEATRHAVAPEPEIVARRGRRRRRRQLAGSALLVAAVVAGGLVLPARLAGRAGPDPAAAPATDVTGAGMLGGYWFGKTDATVYLEQGVDPARRQAIRDRIAALDVVDEVFYESSREAYDRFREQYRNSPEVLATTEPSDMPESFRVRLDAPDRVKQLWRALCPPPEKLRVPGGLAAKPRCIDGVDAVADDWALLTPVLVTRSWATASDVTVVLPLGVTDAQRRAIQARLAAIDGVARVQYETPADAFRRLPEKLHRASGPLPRVTPGSVPASFRVALDQPMRVSEFHRALCGSRRTGACPHGITLVEHPRR